MSFRRVARNATRKMPKPQAVSILGVIEHEARFTSYWKAIRFESKVTKILVKGAPIRPGLLLCEKDGTCSPVFSQPAWPIDFGAILSHADNQRRKNRRQVEETHAC